MRERGDREGGRERGREQGGVKRGGRMVRWKRRGGKKSVRKGEAEHGSGGRTECWLEGGGGELR